MFDNIVEIVQERKGDFPRGLTWLILGEAKVGKTTFGKNFGFDKNNILIIDLENGSKAFPGTRRINVGYLKPPTEIKRDSSGNPILDQHGKNVFIPIPPDQRGHYRDGKPAPMFAMTEVFAHLKEKKEPYETIVLDTIDDLNRIVELVIMEEKGTQVMGDANEFGKDWAAARIKLIRTIEILKSLCEKNETNLVILSHVKSISEKDSETDTQITSLAPDLPSGLRKQVTALADIILYASVTRSGDRIAITKTSGRNTTGSRYSELANKTFDLSFEEIVRLFADHYKKPSIAEKQELPVKL